MATLTYDAVDIIKDLIKTKWSSIRPPTVSAIWEKRSVGFVDDRKDQLIIYPKNEVINYLHTDDFSKAVNTESELRDKGYDHQSVWIADAVVEILVG